MSLSASSIRNAANGVGFADIEHEFNQHIGAFLAQVRHMNQFNVPALVSALSVSKKTYLEMEKGRRHYRMHIIGWWSFIMGVSPLHLVAQSDYFGHLPIGDYRNIRQIKLALLLHRVSTEHCLDALRDLIDHCPRNMPRDVDRSLGVDVAELEGVRDFFYSSQYYEMIATAMIKFLKDHDLTRKELARYLEVTPRTIRRILNAEVSLNYSYYARFYLATGVYPMKVIGDSPYLKIRLKLEQRFYLINELIAGYGSSPDRLDLLLMNLTRKPINPDWLRLFHSQ